MVRGQGHNFAGRSAIDETTDSEKRKKSIWSILRSDEGICGVVCRAPGKLHGIQYDWVVCLRYQVTLYGAVPDHYVRRYLYIYTGYFRSIVVGQPA